MDVSTFSTVVVEISYDSEQDIDMKAVIEAALVDTEAIYTAEVKSIT